MSPWSQFPVWSRAAAPGRRERASAAILLTRYWTWWAVQYAKDVADTIANSNFKVYLSSDVLLMSGLARALSEKVEKKRGWFSFLGF
jgi:hypothetical protein